MPQKTRQRAPRVLIVAPQPFFELRGTPLNVLQVARALRAAGFEVHLASFGLGRPLDVPGIRHHRALVPPGIGSVPIGFSRRKIVMDMCLAATVTRLLLLHRFDVVHAVEESVFYALPLARALRVPVIYDLDSCISDQLVCAGVLRPGRRLQAVRWLERFALRRAQLAITVCHSLTQRVRELAPRTPVAQIEDCPLEELERPADPQVLRRLRSELHLRGHPTVVYTGNMASYQGVDLLLAAVPALASKRPDARVVVVGGSPDRIARARNRVKALGCVEQVVFTGQQPPQRMPEYMAMADVLVSPRRAGTNTPLKLYSYMASGVPIVATDLPMHTQVLSEDTAVLCPPEPRALGRALATVLDSPDRFRTRAAAAKRLVSERFSREVFARRVVECYRAMLADHADTPGTFSISATSRYPSVQNTNRSSQTNVRIAG